MSVGRLVPAAVGAGHRPRSGKLGSERRQARSNFIEGAGIILSVSNLSNPTGTRQWQKNPFAQATANILDELFGFVRVKAEQDATSAAAFLEALEAKLPARLQICRPMTLPGNFLVTLGIALRIVGWDDGDFNFSRRLGRELPVGRDFVIAAFRGAAAKQPDQALARLVVHVLASRSAGSPGLARP